MPRGFPLTQPSPPKPGGEGRQGRAAPACPTDRRRPMTHRRLITLGIATAAAVLVADQASKWWVLNVLDLPSLGTVALLPVLNLTMVWNRGVTFGLLNSLGSWAAPVLGVG